MRTSAAESLFVPGIGLLVLAETRNHIVLGTGEELHHGECSAHQPERRWKPRRDARLRTSAAETHSYQAVGLCFSGDKRPHTLLWFEELGHHGECITRQQETR